ncbi:MAG: ribose 5-phosphate isomerase B [Coriobacteriales bacterium]|nr:ribose 5-phosphate isomerase B [Coriobacteriales bacterium]
MKVAIGSDHAGFAQKESLKKYLANQGHEVIDKGTMSDERCDYPDFAEAVALAVQSGEADRGVLVCGTGIGMALAADKVTGIRAATITSVPFAELCRQHNDLNVICLSGRFVEPEVNEQIVQTFLNTKFEGGRHALRVAKIMRLDHDPARPTTTEETVLPGRPPRSIDISEEASPFNR